MLTKSVQIVGVLGLASVFLSCGGGSNAAYNLGRKAEERKDWDTALVDFEKAKASDPANPLYVLHETNARTNASMLHLKNGRQLVKDGRQEEAAGELQKAARIDPSNKAAQQELDALLTKQAEAKKAHTEAIQKALKAEEDENQGGVVKLKPLSDAPIVHFHFTGDSKQVFTTIAKLAGINVAFTADFRPASLSEDLVNIKLEDALNLVAMQTKSFWKAVTPNTILVVPDTQPNRLAYDTQVVKAIYLGNPMAAADRTAITTAVKTVLGMRNVVDNPDANAIIIRDSPQKVAEAEQLIHKLDRSKAEIMIDISIVEADRDRIRDLGLTPATVNTSTGSITPGIEAGAAFAPTATVSGTTTTVSQIAINTLGYTDYAVALPGATAEAILSDNKTHIMQSPEIRVTDGQEAKVKIGSRIPYAQGSFLPSLAGTTTSSSGSVGLLASTQFQFQDIGVNLDVTPHLLSTGEIGIDAKIEIMSLGASITVGGLSEPTFGQRTIDAHFRLEEGEVNLLGGLLQRTLTNAVTGVPGLGDVPLIRYLFSQEAHEVNDQEVLVMVTPRVIRLPEPAASDTAAVSPGGGGEEAPAGFEGRPFGVPGQQPPQQPPQQPTPPPR